MHFQPKSLPIPLSIALIATLCLASTARAEDKPSPAVKRILDKAVAKVRTNRQDFDKANKKPLDEARAELQDLSTKLIKDGKTDEAGVVLKQVGTLEADVMKMANAPAPVAGGGAVAQRSLLGRLEGKWTTPNRSEVRFFSVDGKFSQQGNGKSYDVPPTPVAIQGSKVSCKTPDGATMTAWPVDEDTVAFVYIMQDGKIHMDGEVWFRSK